MDITKKLQAAITTVMDDYIEAHIHSKSLAGLKYEKVIDSQNLHFQLILLGFNERQRIFNLIFHVDIIDDKIWIQDDNLEYSVAERLTEKGISKQEIVLGYFTASHRQFTEYAVS